MNCLAWNCRGLGNLRIEKELGEIVWAKDPFVVFIAKTLADEARLDMIQANLDFENKWVVPKVRHGGGLALFWRSSMDLMVMDSSNYYIDAWIDKGSNNEWRFIDFYGEPETCRRREAWDSLRTLNHHPDVP